MGELKVGGVGASSFSTPTPTPPSATIVPAENPSQTPPIMLGGREGEESESGEAASFSSVLPHRLQLTGKAVVDVCTIGEVLCGADFPDICKKSVSYPPGL